jgi:hypothetical protein
VTTLCVCGAGPSLVDAPKDSWLWAVNPRAGVEYPKQPDVVVSFDPVYWERGDWKERNGAALVHGLEIPPMGIQAKFNGTNRGRYPRLAGIGHSTWSSTSALIVALNAWAGRVLLAGIDLCDPKYERQSKFWRLLAALWYERLWRIPALAHPAFAGLEVWRAS